MMKKEVMDDLARLHKENKFSGLERIVNIHLLADPFSIENDLLTPTMKLKRAVAKVRFE